MRITADAHVRRALAAAAAAATAAAALGVALAPAAARADEPVRYGVRFDGTATYEHDQATEDNRHTVHDSVAIAFSGSVDSVSFHDGELVGAAVVASKIERGSASRTYVDVDVDAYRRDCTSTSPLLAGPGTMYQSRTRNPAEPRDLVALAPFSGVNFMVSCAGAGGPSGSEVIMLGGGAHDPRTSAAGPFLLEFRMSASHIGEAELLARPKRVRSTDRTCPFRTATTRTCTTSVEAVVRLVRLGATAGRPAPAPAEDDVLTPLTAAPRADRAARRGSVSASCPLGCRYRIRAFPDHPVRRGGGARGRATGSAAATAVAERSGSVRPGLGRRTLAIAFGAGAQRAIRTAGGVRFEVSLDPPIGATVRRSLRAALG